MGMSLITYWQRWLEWSKKSTNCRIFKTAVVVGSIHFLASLIAIAKELFTAYRFGRGDVVDAFVMAFLLPTFVITVIGDSFSSAFIPTYIKIREKRGFAAAKELFFSVMVWSLLLLLAITIVFAFLAQYILPFLASKFTPQKLDLTRRLFFILLPVLVFSGISSMWTAILNAEERFAAGAFTPAINYLTAIIFLFLFGKKWGIFSLAIGTTVGFILQCGLLVLDLKRNKIGLLLQWRRINTDMRDVIKQYMPMATGALAMNITIVVNQIMAAIMFGSGSVAALNYANKIILYIVLLSSTAIATSVLPYFSRMIAHQDWQGIKHTVRVYTRLILLATVPLTVIIVLFSKNIVTLVFQRGAFTQHDTQIVSQIQATYALQIPFYVLGILGIRLMSASLMNTWILLIAISGLSLNVILNLVFSKYFGIVGIALSTSIVYLFSCSAVFLVLWASKNRFSDYNRMVPTYENL